MHCNLYPMQNLYGQKGQQYHRYLAWFELLDEFFPAPRPALPRAPPPAQEIKYRYCIVFIRWPANNRYSLPHCTFDIFLNKSFGSERNTSQVADLRSTVNQINWMLYSPEGVLSCVIPTPLLWCAGGGEKYCYSVILGHVYLWVSHACPSLPLYTPLAPENIQQDAWGPPRSLFALVPG